MIRFQGVHKSFGAGATLVHALRGFDLEIPVGQMCALMGPSGAGKSTVLHLAAGLTSADEGAVFIGDDNVSAMNDEQLSRMRRSEIGIVFQFFNLLPYMTAYENVALPLRLDDSSPAEEREAVEEALSLVGLQDRPSHKPPQLSGGEMQRVAVARALVIKPRVLLADEPTGNLDSIAGRQIMEVLRQANEQTGVTTLLITHDPIWASSCDRIVRLCDGRVDDDVCLRSESEAV